MLTYPEYKERNKVHLSDKKDDTAIYRIMPMSRLEQMLQTRTNTLVKINLWEDRYENFFFKSNFKSSKGFVSADEVASRIFGQCWSFFKDSDALWRIYSPDKQSVRIKTTLSKLYNSAYTDDSCMATTTMGAVSYKTKKDLITWIEANTPISLSDIDKIGKESLFFKRNNFSHEQELRLIYMEAVSSSGGNNIKQYDIDPIDFIEEISFDPRCEESYFTAYKEYLQKKYSYPKDSINKSVLYRFNPIQIDLI